MADYSSAYNYGASDKAGDALATFAPSMGSALTLMSKGNPYAMIGGIALSGLGSFVRGQQQKSKQKDLAKLMANRPVATTPQEVIENQQNARQVASGALANATNQQALNNMNQQGANSVNAMRNSARSSTDLIAGLSGLNQNQNNAFNNLAMQNYGQRLGGMNMLGQANNQMAGYRDRNFEYNVNQPYNQAVQSLMAQTQAGNANMNTAQQNIGNSINNLAYLAPYAQQAGGFNKFFGDLFNRGGGADASKAVQPSGIQTGAMRTPFTIANNQYQQPSSTPNPIQFGQGQNPNIGSNNIVPNYNFSGGWNNYVPTDDEILGSINQPFS
jgi:hypothetical protein